MQSIWPTHLLLAGFLSLIMAARPTWRRCANKTKSADEKEEKTARQYSLDPKKD